LPGERSSTSWGRNGWGFPWGQRHLSPRRPETEQVQGLYAGENFPERFQEAHVTPGSAVNLDFVLPPLILQG
jgi:hypothetical protein